MTEYTSIRKAMRMIAATSSIVLAMGAGSAFANVDLSVDSSNDTTGFNANHEVNVDANSETDVDVRNDGDATNNVALSVDSGDINATENTEVGDISGGDIDVTGDFENNVNDGDTLDLGDAGMLGVDVSSDNRRTGASSNQEVNVDANNEVDVNLRNNADISNNMSLNLKSGNVDVKRNTTVGNVRTGDISAEINTVNNANQGGSKVDLGNLANSNVNVDSSNELTGANSNQEVNVDANNEVDVDVRNDADISNNVSVSTDSGDVDVERNTSVGDITTGDHHIMLNFTNNAN